MSAAGHGIMSPSPKGQAGPVTSLPLPELPGVEHVWLDLSTGVRAHVALAGPADAPPVLALHGWPQHWWSWRRVIEALGDDVRIACPDLRGFGWSSQPGDGRFEKPRLVDDALATLDALGWDRAVLVGHDWGGLAAYLAGLRAPERLHGLVVLAAGHPWHDWTELARNAWRFAYQLPIAAGPWLVRGGGLVALMLQQAWGSDGRFTAAEVAAYVDPLRSDEQARASTALYRSFLLSDAPRLRAWVQGRRLELPTRLIYGTREPLGTRLAAGLERHGDDVRTEWLDGVGHWIPESRPEVVAAAIRALAAPAPAR
jgi:pimeloyl-ACP methyl ester carboxylesterase